MKKEENQKKNSLPKNDYDFRPRSQSPKAYLGCDTCKLKKNKSNSKLSDCGVVQDKNKIKNNASEKGQDERGHKTKDVKLTDLCDEDKKRIVELIEELSRLAEKNQQLRVSLEQAQKEKQEQQDYILKQAQLHLEEKNFYVNEINEFKTRVEGFENKLRDNVIEWENRERCKDKEITYLAKNLQKSLREKNQLHQQMDHLKICLKHSLESFQRLRNEVSQLQRLELSKKHKTTSSQTENKANVAKEKHRASEQEETEEEEFMSTCNQDSVNAKSSLDIINDKLEYVYQMLKRKGETLTNTSSQKHDIDLSILIRNEKSGKGLETDGLSTVLKEFQREDKHQVSFGDENIYMFQKPFEQCSKTSVQAERILKKIGKPLNLNMNESKKKIDNNKKCDFRSEESARETITFSNLLQHNIVQKNTLFKSSDDHQYDEDQLLEELFYPELNANFGLDCVSRPEIQDIKRNFHDRPFTC